MKGQNPSPKGPRLTSSTTLKRSALTGLLTLAVVAPTASAATAPDTTPVAEGKLEHTVSRVTVSGPKVVASDPRLQVGVSADSSRSFTKDIKTGKAVSETADGPEGSFTREAETNKVRFSHKASTPAYVSFAADAANLRRRDADRALVQTGATTVDGWQALVLASARTTGAATPARRTRWSSTARRSR